MPNDHRKDALPFIPTELEIIIWLYLRSFCYRQLFRIIKIFCGFSGTFIVFFYFLGMFGDQTLVLTSMLNSTSPSRTLCRERFDRFMHEHATGDYRQNYGRFITKYDISFFNKNLWRKNIYEYITESF